MTGVQILVLVIALLVIVAALTAVRIRRRRAGGVLIADAPRATHQRRHRS